MMHKIKRILPVFLFVLLFNNPTGCFAQSSGFEIIKSMDLMDQIYEYLEKYYVDEIQPGQLSKDAIDAMLKELDPYTVYYHESNIEEYLLMTTGQYGGIGALIRKIDDYVVISEPYEGNPAHKAGILAGDKIIEVDGNNMNGKSSEDVSNALKGPKGTDVEVIVERQKGEKVKVKITRDEIKLYDVPYYGMVNDHVGYIKLNSFTKTASTEVKNAFLDLKSQGMKELVLDLRGNGGGLLMEAVRIVNMFIEKDQVIVKTKARVAEENRVYNTLEEPVDLKIPLAVLVDGGSASASEIVSGSLQDLDRAVIVGNITYGKGLVQRTYDLDYNSKLKLTIAKYYTPSGRCVQRLEYYDKESGEKPKEIADSLLKKFETKNGRTVIDGRGIEPDISLPEKEFSRLTATIFQNNLVFHYATDYYFSHPEIVSANKFKLSDEEYEEFKKYVLSKDFTYSTASEEMLKKMKTTAEEEGYFMDFETEYNALMAKATPSKENDLDKFKDEIMSLLQNEIVARYYYQKGRTQNAFLDDEALDKAVEILQNQAEYNTILGN